MPEPHTNQSSSLQLARSPNLARSRQRWIFVHGFTQSHSSWWPTIEHLNGARSTEQTEHDGPTTIDTYCLVDLPGHGLSDAPQTHDLNGVAADLVAVGRRGTYVGYSLGGRVALTAAVHDATADHRRIERLVLISTTAGLDDVDQRQQRMRDDDALADRLEAQGLSRFLDDWLDSPLFEGLATIDRGSRERNHPAGVAASLRHHGTGQMTPQWDSLHRIQIPVLIVVGENDAKFRAVGHQLQSCLRHSTMVTIDNVGHSVPLEAPERLSQEIAEWAATLDAQTSNTHGASASSSAG